MAPPQPRTRLHREVFDSEAWRWRRAADLPDLVLGDGAVEAGGVVYWQILDGGAHVFAFDAVREAWKMIPVPRWGGEEEARWSKYSLSAREGKLCLLRFVEYEGGREEMEVWAMHGCMEEWWKREGVVSLQQAQGIKDLYAHHVAFKMDDGLGSKAIWYDFKSLKSKTIPIDIKCGPQPRVFKFESDLSPCSLDTRVDCSLLDL